MRDGSMCVRVVCVVPRCTVRSGRVIKRKTRLLRVRTSRDSRSPWRNIYMIFYNMYNKKFAPQSAKNQKNSLTSYHKNP